MGFLASNLIVPDVHSVKPDVETQPRGIVLSEFYCFVGYIHTFDSCGCTKVMLQEESDTPRSGTDVQNRDPGFNLAQGLDQQVGDVGGLWPGNECWCFDQYIKRPKFSIAFG
jgi:hypothetical protein